MMQMSDKDKEISLIREAEIILEEITFVLQKMRMLAHFSPNQRTEMMLRAKHICIPIADRLGLDDIKAELEDLCLKSSFPALYCTINHLLGSTQEGRQRFIRHFRKPLIAALQKGDSSFTTKSRVKSIASIAEKMGRLGVGIEKIYDVFAIRFILEAPTSKEEEACWQAFTILNKRYEILTEKIRNWLDYPRPSGYKALHVTLKAPKGPWVEVQIRTQKMNEVAEKGSAAHWKYKESGQDGSLAQIEPWLMQIRDVLEQHPQLVKDALVAAESSSILMG